MAEWSLWSTLLWTPGKQLLECLLCCFNPLQPEMAYIWNMGLFQKSKHWPDLGRLVFHGEFWEILPKLLQTPCKTSFTPEIPTYLRKQVFNLESFSPSCLKNSKGAWLERKRALPRGVPLKRKWCWCKVLDQSRAAAEKTASSQGIASQTSGSTWEASRAMVPETGVFLGQGVWGIWINSFHRYTLSRSLTCP